MTKVFTYGTLMKGCGNHRFVLGTTFVGEGETTKEYGLFVDGLPYVSESDNVSTIKGELYEVSDRKLEDIDMLEGHPHFYERKEVEVEVDGETHTAYMYFYKRQMPYSALVPSGDYREAIHR